MGYCEEIIRTPDGRALEVARVGADDGVAVIFHHGSPGAASFALCLEAMAERHGLFVATSSRAGYGHSDPHPGRDVASVVEDVAALREHFGIEHYVAAGWSGGGPHALACAALDDACVGAVSLAGVAPIDADFDWTEGMGPENLEEFALAREGGAAFFEHMESMARGFADATAENLVALFGGLLSSPDAAALENATEREWLARECRDAFVVSAAGLIDDDRAFVAPWGFDPSAIAVPVEVWYGGEDLMVPPTHGAWLARNIPGANPVHLHSEGHVSLLVSHQDVLAEAILALAEMP
jgi:pimeloyl-ACP methyl ester carboxylesterase